MTTTPDLTASTTSPQEVAPHLDAAGQWKITIEAIQAYMRECETHDDLDLSRDLDRESAQQDG
ncbi:MAG: hypothetical protein E6Q97_23790 [Desulfurellales bacterium]|nr:MAG: hypothetical protein E6Q97_23790 [Desulfurellales bacterium]